MIRIGPGIDAPATVPEGTNQPIEVDAAGSSEISVVVSTTGEEIYVTVGADGKARFQLPTSATAGATLLVTDSKNPGISTEILVVPATGS
jgi:hypothetical protein